MKLLSGTSNPQFAKSLAHILNADMVDCDISKFKNGEKRIWIHDDIAGENICLVQSFSGPVDEHIIETLLLVDALERAGARHVSLVIPWMGYSLQDKVFRSGEPIAAKVIANILSASYLKRVVLLDLHNSSIPGFFSVPTHHLPALNLFADYARDNFDLTNCITISPDFGGLKRARKFAEKLNLELENIDKHRDLHTGEVTPRGISGDVSDKICLIYDDVINTGGTVVETARYLKQKGAKEVHFLITHGLFAAPKGPQKMDVPEIDSIVITNSLLNQDLPTKIKILDAAPIVSESLRTWL